MLVLFGLIIVMGAVFGGFVLEDGHLAALFQPYELLMIGGGALGAFVIANDKKSMLATLRALPTLLHGSKYSKGLYIELMSLLSELLNRIRKEGLMSLENDVDNPQDSAIFIKYPRITSDRHILEFITDYLRLMVSGSMDAYQIENLMDNEIATYHEDGEMPIHAMSKLADGMPAFGIVAAVMGVVHTMGSVGIPPAELGKLIAAALVGTFLGILLSYGLVAPLASLLQRKHQESTKMYQCIKVTLLASLNGYAPPLAVEFGRKVISASERPTFRELEIHFKEAKNKAA